MRQETQFTIAGFAAMAIVAGFYVGYNSSASAVSAAGDVRSEAGFSEDAPALPSGVGWEEMRDAVASPAPVRPPELRPAPAPAALVQERDSWVRSQSLFMALTSGPIDFIAKKTLLASGAGFARFCKDPVRVDRYLRHPLIRGVLDSPALLGGLLGSQAVIDGFLRSPAMQDPRAIAALAGSPLLRRIANDPGIQKTLGRPGVLNGIISNPNTLSWLMSHPDGMSAFLKVSPAAARALGR